MRNYVINDQYFSELYIHQTTNYTPNQRQHHTQQKLAQKFRKGSIKHGYWSDLEKHFMF